MALPSSGPLSLDDIRDYIVPIAGIPLYNPISLDQLATALVVPSRVSDFYSYDLNIDKAIYLAALRATMYPTTLTTAELDAVNELFSDLDTYGLYSKITAFYPMLGTTSATQRLNAKSSGGVRQSVYDLIFYGGWSFAGNGATGNGSNTHWLVDYTYTDTTILDSHFSIYQIVDNGSNSSLDIALYEFPIDNYYSPIGYSNDIGGNIVFNYSYSNNYYTTKNDPAATIITYENASSKAIMLQSGPTQTSYEESYTVTPDTLPTTYVGGGYEYGNNVYTNKTFGFITFGQYLDGTERANLQAAINGFQSTIGRNIF